jgi:hypothetical protein
MAVHQSIVYAVSADRDGLHYGTVTRDDQTPQHTTYRIVSRMGDVLYVDQDAVRALIAALQKAVDAAYRP